MISDEAIRGPLSQAWGLGHGTRVARHDGGMGSQTWIDAATGLPIMLRFRWAVQADYFAWRITAGDLTGITGPEQNEKGLEGARRALLLARAPGSARPGAGPIRKAPGGDVLRVLLVVCPQPDEVGEALNNRGDDASARLDRPVSSHALPGISHRVRPWPGSIGPGLAGVQRKTTRCSPRAGSSRPG